MSDHDGLHLLWVSDDMRMNIEGPFASEGVARIAASWCDPNAVLARIEFVDDPAPLMSGATS